MSESPNADTGGHPPKKNKRELELDIWTVINNALVETDPYFDSQEEAVVRYLANAGYTIVPDSDTAANRAAIGPPPPDDHDPRCEDFDTKPGVYYHAHDLPRCRETATGSLPVQGGTKFLCQRHIDARLVFPNGSSETR